MLKVLDSNKGMVVAGHAPIATVDTLKLLLASGVMIWGDGGAKTSIAGGSPLASKHLVSSTAVHHAAPFQARGWNGAMWRATVGSASGLSVLTDLQSRPGQA